MNKMPLSSVGNFARNPTEWVATWKKGYLSSLIAAAHCLQFLDGRFERKRR